MSLDLDSIAYVRELVRRHAGIVLGEDKGYLVESRLTALGRTLGGLDSGALVAAVRDGDEATLAQVVDCLTTNETHFFRDPQSFELLREHVLPTLIEQRRTVRRLRIWCAACASGQEVDSLLMLISEHLPELLEWDFLVLGTDLSQRMIDRCNEARYSAAEVSRGLPDALRARYFRSSDSRWSPVKSLREHCYFKTLNLLDAFAHNISADLVMMRNVLIYFDRPTKESILRQARRVLPPDGALLLGTAETTLGLDVPFIRGSVGGSAYYTPAPPLVGAR